jgi:GT2 family glycosyltransferase
MKTSIIVLTYNKLEFTQQCIESVRTFTSPSSYELIVVDNASSDGTIAWLRNQADIRLISNAENRGFPAGCNQGIAAAGGDNILLLNNDTVVTPNWLDNLVTCLYSSERVGAVGPVTNYASYYQAIRVGYQTIAEMHSFAKAYNKSDPRRWEERIKLIGFCMLIRRSVIDEIGLLDEQFSPGHFEDDDYSLRIRRAGYRLFLCVDTFIHHYGSVSFRDDREGQIALSEVNARKFEAKWGFHPLYSTYIRGAIIQCMDAPADRAIRVLEVGCGCGATLVQIRNRFRNAEIYGMEINQGAATDARLYARMLASDIENMALECPHDYFDFVIFADVLEHLRDPWTVLEKIKPYLVRSGQVLASIPNVMHYTVVRDLINGHWTYRESGILDKTHLRFFTAREIEKMFTQAGYRTIAIKDIHLVEQPRDLEFVQKLAALTDETMAGQYKTYQYVVKAGLKAPAMPGTH